MHFDIVGDVFYVFFVIACFAKYIFDGNGAVFSRVAPRQSVRELCQFGEAHIFAKVDGVVEAFYVRDGKFVHIGFFKVSYNEMIFESDVFFERLDFAA